jgi:hypothetical protein
LSQPAWGWSGRATGIGSPSEVTQKKASSRYEATTNAVVVPKQGVTPKRGSTQTTPQLLLDDAVALIGFERDDRPSAAPPS